MPSLLEYLSYCCNFMGILAGPLCSYKDYIAFIEGRSYHVKEAEVNGKEDLKYDHKEPSPNIRSNVRHHFLQSPELKLIYDVMTWIATQVAISYTVAPFVLLSVKPSLQFYSSWYYCLHILCVLVLLLMPARARKKERTDKESIAPPLENERTDKESIAPPPENVKKDEKTSEHNSHAATNNNSSQREETAWRRPSAPQ
ncbi:hypothetical protein GDO81_007201 [Engystomops pustulosus]|nr:hypothetical protein GDO81_007201 [Engystomops pustulosus]